jgi:hypothetical protein
LYEYQLPLVHVGQTATMTLSYLPGRQFQGKVAYIDPTLNDKTRQVDLRLEFDNPDGTLKPGMFATIDLHSTLANDHTLAPRSAIIDTGEREVAFVSLGNGRFDPRQVQTGARAEDGMVEVLAGLAPGQQVVTSGQFLIDSEANVREALAKMVKGNLAAEQMPVPATSPDQVSALPPAASQPLRTIVGNYLSIEQKLAADSIEGLGDPAKAIAAQADELLKLNLPGGAQATAIRDKALELAGAKSLDQARPIFADLSAALDKLLKTTGSPQGLDRPIQELHCPMYRPDQGGAFWLQAAGPVHNPYLGTMMPACGQVIGTLGGMANHEGQAAQ